METSIGQMWGRTWQNWKRAHTGNRLARCLRHTTCHPYLFHLPRAWLLLPTFACGLSTKIRRSHVTSRPTDDAHDWTEPSSAPHSMRWRPFWWWRGDDRSCMHMVCLRWKGCEGTNVITKRRALHSWCRQIGPAATVSYISCKTFRSIQQH